MTMPGMLHVQVLALSRTRMRASFLLIRPLLKRSEGVAGIITSADVPGEDGFGVFVNDQPVMAQDKVRYVGEAVAAVAAEDPLIAKRALSSINVVYAPLPSVFDPEEALCIRGTGAARLRTG